MNRTRWFVVSGVLVAMVLAVGVSQWASSSPDGLERVAADQGIDADADPHTFADAPFADYGTSGLGERPGLAVSGLVGLAACFAVAAGATASRPPTPNRGMTFDTLLGPVDTPVHRMAPQVKLAALLTFVVAVVATPDRSVWAVAMLGALVAVAVGAAGLPMRVLARRLVIEVPFLLFALALPLIGRPPRQDVLGVSVSTAGCWAAWGIVCKALLAGAAAVVLAWTTPVADVLVGLERLRVPRVLTAIAGFMVRYAEVVSGELHRLQVARVSRGDDPRWWWQGRAVAATAGTMFVRSFERGERVQRAMVARGYTGTMPAGDPGPVRGATVGAGWPAAVWAGVAMAVAAVAVTVSMVAPS